MHIGTLGSIRDCLSRENLVGCQKIAVFLLQGIDFEQEMVYNVTHFRGNGEWATSGSAVADVPKCRRLRKQIAHRLPHFSVEL